MPNTYTQRTLNLLRDQGFKVGVVERWIPGANIRKDLFGIIDIIAISSNKIIGIQSTSYKQRKPHLDTIYGSCLDSTKSWLDGGGELWLISWKKIPVKPGSKRFKYESVIDVIELEKEVTAV